MPRTQFESSEQKEERMAVNSEGRNLDNKRAGKYYDSQVSETGESVGAVMNEVFQCRNGLGES